jgi:hypothetical protein
MMLLSATLLKGALSVSVMAQEQAPVTTADDAL